MRKHSADAMTIAANNTAMPSLSTTDTTLALAARRVVLWLAICLGAAALGFKAWLIGQQGFHWDEFWFLSQIHMAWREGAPLFPGALYLVVLEPLRWIGDEIVALQTGRSLMLVLLTGSAWLLYRLSRHWMQPAAAAFGAAAFLASTPVLASGASLRVDSLLLPLLLGALVLLAGQRAPWKAFLAGGLLGLAVAFSPKIVLFAPLVIVAWWAGPGSRGMRQCLADHSAIALTASMVAAGAWLVQAHVLPAQAREPYQAGSLWSAMLGGGWLPQGEIAAHLGRQNIMLVVALAGGMLVSARRSPWLLGFSMALAPILFYRNSYDYFYVLMLAPACVLAGFFMQGLLGDRTWRATAGMLVALAFVLNTLWLVEPISSWRHQQDQKRVLEIVRQAFPRPTPYIDHGGVLSDFPKANPFMSAWGMQEYLTSGQPFMPEALRKGAALMVHDRDTLRMGMDAPGVLLPADRALLNNTYLPWWGPIWVAGRMLPSGDGRMTLPMAGDYRLESTQPVFINGVLHLEGDTLKVSQDMAVGGVEIRWKNHVDPNARLIWATARRAPQEKPPLAFYQGR